MTEETHSSLLPCPFCGGEANLDYDTLYNEVCWYVSCCHHANACGARGQSFGGYEANHKEKAIKAWNTRAKTKREQELEEEVERLREALDKIDDICFTGLMNPNTRLDKIHKILALRSGKHEIN